MSCGFSRFVPRHEDELYLEIDDPVLIIDQSEDLWCHGYNMRTGSTGIFPAFYTVEVTKEPPPGKKAVKAGSSHLGRPLKFCFSVSAQKEGWTEQFLVRFLGSVQVPMHKGNGVLCAAMQKVDRGRDESLLDTPTLSDITPSPSSGFSHTAAFIFHTNASALLLWSSQGCILWSPKGRLARNLLEMSC